MSPRRSSNLSRKARIVTIVGARPQYIKLAPLQRALAPLGLDHRIINTGQHYDYQMAGVFFRELRLPKPTANLEVGSADAAEMTARILERCAVQLRRLRPDLVVVIGDTNSTLGGALAAAQLHLPMAHIEAGLRCFDLGTPEELNRLLTDRMAQALFCPTPQAVANLTSEGLTAGVSLTGDLLYDVLTDTLPGARETSAILESLKLTPQSYYVATLHRADSVDDRAKLTILVEMLCALPAPTIFPVHPRTSERLRAFKLLGRLRQNKSVRLVEPVRYRQMLALIGGCRMLLTDSGGLQREAYFLRRPTALLREVTEWVEIVRSGGSVIVGFDPAKLRKALTKHRFSFSNRAICRTGAAARIARKLAAAVR